MNDIKVPVALRRAPTVDIELAVENGTATYKLAYDFKAICQIKATTGRSLLNGNVWENIEDDPDLFVAIVWAGLQLHHPELALEEVAHMMIAPEFKTYLTAVSHAWLLVKPKVDVDPKTEPTTRAAAAPDLTTT